MAELIADHAQLSDWLRQAVAAQTGRTATEVDLDQPIDSHGLDSEAAVAISGELITLLRRQVDPTIFYNHSTLSQAVNHLLGQDHQDAAERRMPVDAASPVALVGIGCQFPGSSGRAGLWTTLNNGHDPITAGGIERWDLTEDSPETSRIKWGGFLGDIDRFAARTFGISDAEALAMDPQQRLLLEVAAETLEDAGIASSALRGRRGGVFLGISSNDYARRQVAEPASLSAYMPTGNALSVAANRISYAFDLSGPSLAIDTACSSSLVACILAMRSLQRGECDVAFAGGVNLMLEPEVSVALARAGMLATDGRCKTFDSRADGYVRSEGCGLVLLKRLEDARRDGDRIYAVVLGGAVNQDGRSNGLTAPNGAAQRALIRTACVDAQIEPSELGFVETHGTGTVLGDPIEIEALADVYCSPTRDRPLRVGSIKSNLGHLEAAAGVAGLIKAALTTYLGRIPANLHFERRNTHISVPTERLVVNAEPWVWDRPASERICAVSSFGFGGTNAHVILRGEDAEIEAERPLRTPILAPFSAPSPDSLGRLLTASAAALETAGGLRSVGRTLGVRRAHHPHRCAFVADDVADLSEQLRAWRPPAQSVGRTRHSLWVFSGQGSLRPGMGRRLWETEPLYRSTLRRCGEVVADLAGWDLEKTMVEPDGAAALNRTEIAQPCLVAHGLATAALLRASGFEPDAVVGHSVGELTAAAVAGVLTRDQAMALAVHRGQAMAGTRGGRMLAVQASEEEAQSFISEDVDIAAINAEDDVVLSGSSDALRRISDVLGTRGRSAIFLPVDYAFHSRGMTTAASVFASEVVHPGRPSKIPFYSTVTGARIEGGEVDAEHWRRNVADRVLFHAALNSMGLAGVESDLVVEIAARSVLRRAIASNLRHQQPTARLVDTGGDDDRRAWLNVLGAAYECGWNLNFAFLSQADSGLLDLPHPERQRDSFWIGRRTTRPKIAGGLDRGVEVALAGVGGAKVWNYVIATAETPVLMEHRVRGVALLPAAATLELMRRAASESGLKAVTLENVTFTRPVQLNDDDVSLQLTARTQDGGLSLSLHRQTEDGVFELCAQAEARQMEGAGHSPTSALPPAQPVDGLYAALRERGLEYGPSFQALESATRLDQGQWTGRVRVPPTVERPAEIATVLLDAALHLIAAAFSDEQIDGLYVPVGVASVNFSGLKSREAAVEVSVRRSERRNRVIADVRLVGDGEVELASLHSLELARFSDDAEAGHHRLRWYREAWPAASVPPRSPTPGQWAVLGDGDLASSIRQALEAAGAAATLRSAAGFGRDEAPWVRLMAELAGTAPDLAGLVVVLDDDGTVDGPALTTLSAIRALSYGGFPAAPRLYLVTVGGFSADAQGAARSPALAAARGIGRCAHFETPGLVCTFIDADPEQTPGEASSNVCEELLGLSVETEIAFRKSERRVRRIVRAGPRGRQAAELGGTIVVTGATGALGTATVQRLLSIGARDILAISRNPPTEPWWSSLGDKAGRVRHLAADMGRADAEALLASALTGPVVGAIHAAGIVDDAALLDLDAERVSRVMRAKCAGVETLSRCLAPLGLKWLVLYSSAASVLGSPGQGAYAAANAYLDGFADAHGFGDLRVATINWGPWAGDGMAASGTASAGLQMIAPEDGLDALEEILESRSTAAMVLPFDLKNLIQYYPDGPGFTAFESLLSEERHQLRSVGGAKARLVRPELSVPFLEPRTDMERVIAGIWQRAFGLDRVGVHDGFFELGGDSVFANQILMQINARVGVTIRPEEGFEDLTIERLAELAEREALAIISSLDDHEAQLLLESES